MLLTVLGAHLDVALFPTHALTDNVLRIFFGPLKALKVLLDNDVGGGKAIATATKAAYEQDPEALTDEVRAELKADIFRLLSKIEGYTHEPSVAVYHMSFYYQRILPAWFELRERWSLPAHEAVPLLRQQDPEFAAMLDRFCCGTVDERIHASRDIFQYLFGE